jgi:CRISPR/Cas system CMR subunit Cmr4 (Cas7 group RAMP superfamily)
VFSDVRWLALPLMAADALARATTRAGRHRCPQRPTTATQRTAMTSELSPTGDVFIARSVALSSNG